MYIQLMHSALHHMHVCCRLYYGLEGGLWLSERGSAKKNWEWADDTAFIQPLVLSLNASITLKVTSQVCNQLYNNYTYITYTAVV